MKDSVEKRVAILKSNPDYGAVSSDAYYYDEDNLERPVGRASDGLRNCNSSYQFELSAGRSIYFLPWVSYGTIFSYGRGKPKVLYLSCTQRSELAVAFTCIL